MRDRLRARRDRVLEVVDLGEILQEYGYAVVPDRYREQQFSCDLHGQDHKPSARYYGENNTTYCWVCQKKRDAIAYVMEKEHLDFREAIELLERRMSLPPLPWSDEDPGAGEAQASREQAEARRAAYQTELAILRKFLDGLTEERLRGEAKLSCATLLSFWEVLDRVDYGVAKEGWSEAKGIEAIHKLREQVLQRLERAESC